MVFLPFQLTLLTRDNPSPTDLDTLPAGNDLFRSVPFPLSWKYAAYEAQHSRDKQCSTPEEGPSLSVARAAAHPVSSAFQIAFEKQ
jgi:hypothetical protein